MTIFAGKNEIHRRRINLCNGTEALKCEDVVESEKTIR